MLLNFLPAVKLFDGFWRTMDKNAGLPTLFIRRQTAQNVLTKSLI